MSITKIRRERTDKPLPERFVSMSNSIIRSAQGLNLSQKRMIALALAKTDSLPARDLITSQSNGWTVRFFASEYAETYGIDTTTAYQQMMECSVSLMKTIWSLIEDRGKKKTIVKGPWIILGKYTEGEGRMDITFSQYVAPHLLALRSQFTTYKLKQAAALRSIYSWRMLECLQSWKSTGKWTVNLEEFCKIMEAPPSCVANFKDLRKRIIEPAITELTTKDAFIIEWNTIKAGRKVIGLDFQFQLDPQGRLQL